MSKNDGGIALEQGGKLDVKADDEEGCHLVFEISEDDFRYEVNRGVVQVRIQLTNDEGMALIAEIAERCD